MKKWDVIVVGGGAAGLVAAGQAAQQGAKVILLEKNIMVGKKLLITGKGRCNITNASAIEELIRAFGSNGNFLYSAFYSFSNIETISFFNKLGVATKIERGNRVFPQSELAKEVVESLVKYVKQQNVVIQLEANVKEVIVKKENQVQGVRLSSGQEIKGNQVILATGGASYPGTGSTGDGYHLAKQLGHKIIPIKPALVPLVAQEKWVKDLQGLALKNVELSIIKNHKKATSLFGEMLFTHFGISGPIVLTLSKEVGQLLEKQKEPIVVSIDLKPALTEEKLDLRLQRDFAKFNRKLLNNSLGELLPKALIPVILEIAGINGNKHVHQISREERRELVFNIKDLKLTIIKTRPLKEAIVTAGGINIKEVDPRTMESRKAEGLFLAGELLDLDGVTGGFNLQAAFSTGFVAGNSAAKKAIIKKGEGNG